MTRYSFSAIRILSLAVLLALAMGGWKTTPAFADGETPPPPDEGTTDLTDGVATEGPAPTDVTSTEVAPVPTEAITEEAAAPVITTDAASTEIAIDSAPVEGEVPEPAPAESEETIDLLAELPEGTELVVVNAEGESVPLASEEASAIIAGGDPIWCPSGVAPKPLVGGCSNTYGSLDQLVAFFTPPSSGTIWFEHGSVDAGTRINGGLFENWEAARNFSLTLQGGWSGAYGSTALDPVDPYTYFDGLNFDYIWITNWVGAVTLKNLVFNAATYDVDFADYVVYVETAGNIKLDKVTVNDGQNDHVNWATYGAYLDNTSGTGSITVTNSSFNNNEADGLRALSNGTITLKNVFANNNGYRGSTLDNTSAATAKSATISNFISNGNGLGGLVVKSSGTVTLNNISASNNSWIGAYVENDDFGIYPVYVNGVNNFSTNTGHGLQVVSNGAIKVSKTTAIDNGGDGAHLDNSGSSGYQPITIAGFFTAIGNDGDGLEILSRGNVTATYLTANNNGENGVTIDNTYAGIPRSVTITGYNLFNDNERDGLVIDSRGSVVLYNLSASGNYWRGVRISNWVSQEPPVTINGYILVSENFGSGLSILSAGTVTLSNITAVGNGDPEDGSTTGVTVQNGGGTYSNSVNIKGVNMFSGNGGGSGLLVISDGAISVSKTTAIDNSGDGAHLDNGGSSGYQPITIAGFFTAIGNDGDGLEILSRGNVTAAYLTANNNGVHGVTINNTYAGIPKSVTIAGYNVFNDNEGDGFYEGNGLGIESLGSIVLYNLSASNNGRDGVSLYNTGCNSQYPVSIYGVNIFSGNGRNGLYLFSHGSVTLNNVIAVENGLVSLGNGVEVHNINMCLGSVFYPKPVVVKGTNTFLSNNDTGIYVDSAGAISVSNVTANKNGFGGAFLYNRFLDFLSQNNPTTAPVTINGYGVFEYNGYVGGYNQSGLTIKTHGSVTLANINANYNYGSGVNIDTIGVSATHSVTLNGTNTFIGNGTDGTESGLVVNADGTIKVNNLTAMSNHYYGAYLDNYTNWAENGFSYPGSVLVTGFGYFSANGVGLYVDTHKSVTLNRITANGNFAGMDISADGNVTLVCSSAWGNLFTAVAIDTPGVITLKGLLTYLNGTNESFTSYTSLLRSTCP